MCTVPYSSSFCINHRRVHRSFTCGTVATQDSSALTPGWHHVAAVRGATGGLKIYCDGALVATSSATTITSKAEQQQQEEEEEVVAVIDISAADAVPLIVGGGPLGNFAGKIRELQIYKGALSQVELERQAAAPPPKL